jgi:hypothetical protein
MQVRTPRLTGATEGAYRIPGAVDRVLDELKKHPAQNKEF